MSLANEALGGPPKLLMGRSGWMFTLRQERMVTSRGSLPHKNGLKVKGNSVADTMVAK